MSDNEAQNWRLAMPAAELETREVIMQRIDGRQIAFFNSEKGIRACDNRCPHEGYPLSEGSLGSDCILTCNWHNWKFNLDNGENLFGGDKLRVYPVQIRGGDIWVNIADPPYAQRYAAICDSLRDAFDDYRYDRIAREIARLIRLGADPLDVLRLSIEWSWERLEFGWTHAYAGMADWLRLYREHEGNAELQLVCLSESVAHVAYDVLRENNYAYPEGLTPFDEGLFVEAMENENQAAAIAALRGGIRDGLRFDDFEQALSSAALNHYSDFGHSLIYLTKAKALIAELGDIVLEPLLLSLVRGYIFASREDRIPEFRAYAGQLKKWGQSGAKTAHPDHWRKKSINQSMQAVLACSAQAPMEIYRCLLLANALNLLSFDIAQQEKIRIPVSGNVGWLDFTHGLTFASAVRQQCSLFPQLWPKGLLQMACFNGRNAGFTCEHVDAEAWLAGNLEEQLRQLLEKVMDHGQAEPIVAVHLLKTAVAVRDEVALLEARDGRILVAALQRFFDSPIKRHQGRRTAHQSLQFVARE